LIEEIINIDKTFFLWLNSFHTPELDITMKWLTNSATWLPFPIFLVFYIFKNNPFKISIKYIFLTILAIGLSDFATSRMFKPYFLRLRPCYDETLHLKMILVGNCGGQYGFVSSHAATSTALACMFFFFSKKNDLVPKFLIFWAIIICYTRIYLGVHFPLDIIGGAIVGYLISFIIFKIYLKLNLYKT
jgi:undecaprenyl-diphosphatase